MNNLILSTDSYKISHWNQMPSGLEYAQYYIEPRAGGKYPEIMVAGLAYLARLLERGVTREDVEEARAVYDLHLGEGIFNYSGWMSIVEELDGKLPIEVLGLPEGTVVNTGLPIAVVTNTISGYAWLVGHLETLCLRAVWYPTTVATESFQAKRIIAHRLQQTTEARVIPEVLPFRLHDFGSRGVSSAESSAIGGVAHLYNFLGTDNVEALMLARRLYGETMAGFSIPAREHSTTTIYGPTADNEDEAFLNSIENFGSGLFAVVIDSYDTEAALERLTTGRIRAALESSRGTMVLRPDSGIPEEQVLMALEAVESNVGVTVNSKGFKVLPSCYRIIQGDGVNTREIANILELMQNRGWSAENVAFGMGGGLLQHCDRDTLRFAMKMCAAIVNGEYRGVCKSPKTDPSKSSKTGFLDLFRVDDQFVLMKSEDLGVDPWLSSFVTYFNNGIVSDYDSLAVIRARAEQTSPRDEGDSV